MNKKYLFVISIILVAMSIGGIMWHNSTSQTRQREPTPPQPVGDEIALPTPISDSDTSLEHALQQRRSVRAYRHTPLTLAELSQLLWAAQGMTDPAGYRTTPSAGALYPLELYVLVGSVSDLGVGSYHYRPHKNALIKIDAVDKRDALRQAALDQEAVADAAAVIVITAVYDRTTVKYGERGVRYVHMEVGSAAQNIYLQAVSLDLGTVFIGAFYDDEVSEILNLGDDERPLCLMPVGHAAE